MKKALFAFFITITVFSCKSTKPVAGCIGTPTVDCICTKEYLPVCGCDGKTYSNACEAKCAGVATWTEGACGK